MSVYTDPDADRRRQRAAQERAERKEHIAALRETLREANNYAQDGMLSFAVDSLCITLQGIFPLLEELDK
jgi:hypothetical protein